MPMKREKPRTKRFLEELRSTYCRVDRPTDEMMANITQNTPPTTGSGIVTNTAPTLPSIPNANMMIAPTCTTRRLPTYMTLYRIPLNIIIQFSSLLFQIFTIFSGNHFLISTFLSETGVTMSLMALRYCCLF